MDLNAHFHSIDGATVGERRQNYNKLIGNLGKQDISVASLTPTNYLEELLKVDGLILLNDDHELFKILKEGNSILIHRVIKRGFAVVQRRITSLSANEFVLDFFPALSLTTKIKVLNKLAEYRVSETKADELYSALKEEYGLHLALKLLPCCSCLVIENASKLPRFYLDPKQLLLTVKKHPQLIVTLVDSLVAKGGGHFQQQYQSVLYAIFDCNLDAFLHLVDKHKLTLKLSKRRTKRLIESRRNEITKYNDVIHFKQAEKLLGDEIINYFFDSCCNYLNDYNIDYFIRRLKVIKCQARRRQFFDKIIKDKFDMSVLDDPTLITPTLLKFLDKRTRLEYVSAHEKPPAFSEDDWMIYHDTDTSIPYFKNRIHLTSKKLDRQRLLQYLVETCAVNDDHNALTEVCKYFLKTHQNDSCTLRQSFLSEIDKHFDMIRLSDQVWPLILSIIELFIVRQERVWISGYGMKYIEYLRRQGDDIRKGVELCIRSDNMPINLFSDKPLVGRMCIQSLIEVVPVAKDLTDDERERLMFTCLREVTDWNTTNSKQKISLVNQPAFFAFFKKVLTSRSSQYNYYYTMLSLLLMQEQLNAKSHEILLLFITEEIFPQVSLRFIYWLTRNYPSLVSSNLELIFHHLINTFATLREEWVWKCFRAFAHLQIPQRICKLLDFTVTDTQTQRVRRCITAALFLMPIEEFRNSIQDFIPKRIAITEVDPGLLQVQKSLGNSLMNYWQPYQLADVVVKFCIKDYMLGIVSTLHNFAYRMNENKLEVFLRPLEKESAVSINKHTLYVYRLCKRNASRDYLVQAVDKEKNPSIRKVLLRILFRDFTANADQFIWELFKKCFEKIDGKDTEVLEFVFKLNKIPDEYLIDYVHFIWQRIGTFELSEERLNETKANFIDNWPKAAFVNVPSDFVMDIIRGNLFKTHKMNVFERNVQSFACAFLSNATDEHQDRILKEIADLVRNYMDKYWDGERQFCSFTLRNFLFNSLEKFDYKLLEKLKNTFGDLFSVSRGFQEHFILEFGLISFSQSVEDASSKLISLFNSVDRALCNMLYEFLRGFLDKFIDRDQTKRLDEKFFTLIHQIVSCKSVNCLIMSCLMMNGHTNAITPKAKDLYDEIVNILKNCSDDVVDMYLYHYVIKV